MIDHILPVLEQKIFLEDILILLHFENLPSLKKEMRILILIFEYQTRICYNKVIR